MILRPLTRAVATLVLVAGSSDAQERRHGSWVTVNDAAVLGAAGFGSALLIGWDRQLSVSVRESSLQGNRGVRSLMDLAGVAGDPGAVLVGAGLWASGKFGGDQIRARLGLRAMEAIAVSGFVTAGGKALMGRARPDQAPGAPRNFVLGRGFGDRSEFQSFPSGHATAAFAFASAIDAELQRIAPKYPTWIVPLLYGLATATAVSRVYHDRHWASDVVMGSAVGFVGGRAVVRWHGDRR